MPLLSIIIPVFNEIKTIRQILDKINAIAIDKEIIVVDDGSTDGTDRLLSELHYANLNVILHSTNRGKGAAFLTGLSACTGEFVIIQDADLEYDPADYFKLIEAIKSGGYGLILGARFIDGRQGLFLHRLGNKFLTTLLNLLYSARLNDYATCYKLARREVFHKLGLKATGFDIDVEIVCNAIKQGLKIKEVPVNYYPRNYREGKKIRFRDALWTVFYMLKYRLRGL